MLSILHIKGWYLVLNSHIILLRPELVCSYYLEYKS